MTMEMRKIRMEKLNRTKSLGQRAPEGEALSLPRGRAGRALGSQSLMTSRALQKGKREKRREKGGGWTRKAKNTEAKTQR